jgi:uncharacterized protein YbjT (DUF2867 family)
MKKRTIFITGATGNVGREVIRFLSSMDNEDRIIAGVRNLSEAENKIPESQGLIYRVFDFEDSQTFVRALEDVDILFLLRPPHLSDVRKFFKPLLLSARDQGIKKIVFLSVQGAERSKVIPHNKIESLIKSMGFRYIFVRPGYFMQNLITSLLPEIKNHQSITLPSGDAKFNWIDVKDIGEVSAVLLDSFDTYQNNAFIITGQENKNFQEVTEEMTRILGFTIVFRSINPISFFFRKKKEGMTTGYALVMTLLHFLPRVQPEPDISSDFFQLTKKKPILLRDFIYREKDAFVSTKSREEFS